MSDNVLRNGGMCHTRFSASEKAGSARDALLVGQPFMFHYQRIEGDCHGRGRADGEEHVRLLRPRFRPCPLRVRMTFASDAKMGADKAQDRVRRRQVGGRR